MKKLFALVLTLALVFAIAAPAMALSWDAPAAPVVAKSPFKVGVTQLKTVTTALGDGTEGYDELPAGTALVAGMPVRVMVDFYIPTQAEYFAQYGVTTLPTTPAYTVAIATSNLSGLAIVNDESSDYSGAEIFTTDGKTISIVAAGFADPSSSATKGTWITCVFTATLTKTAEAVVKATFNYYGSAATAQSKLNNKTYDLTLATASNITTLTVKDSASSDQIVYTTKANATAVTSMKITAGGLEYLVAARGQYYTTVAPVALVDDATTINTINTVYDAIVPVTGIGFGTVAHLTAANFQKNYNFGSYLSETATYKAYTGSLTVTDGTNVPNTGDNMSVIGFVMVGLALLATAAVVVKKVRA